MPSRSTLETFNKLKQFAHTQANIPFEEPPPPESDKTLLFPIFIGLDRESGDIREQFLWRIGDPSWDTSQVASKFCSELLLGTQQVEGFVREQISAGLSSIRQWTDLGGEKRVKLQVYARHGSDVVVDEVEWDVSCPVNLPQQYAALTCCALGLGPDWAEALRAHVERLVADVRQDLQSSPEDVVLLPPLKAVRRSAEPQVSGRVALPRLQAWHAEEDLEAGRQQARAAKAEQRRQAAEAVAAAARQQEERRAREEEEARRKAEDARAAAALEEQRARAAAAAAAPQPPPATPQPQFQSALQPPQPLLSSPLQAAARPSPAVLPGPAQQPTMARAPQPPASTPFAAAAHPGQQAAAAPRPPFNIPNPPGSQPVAQQAPAPFASPRPALSGVPLPAAPQQPPGSTSAQMPSHALPTLMQQRQQQPQHAHQQQPQQHYQQQQQ